MKQALAFIALVAVAVGVWFLRGANDATLLGAKDAQIAAMNETLQAKEKVRVQDETLLDVRDTSIKELQDKIKSDEDLLAKNLAEIDADKLAYQKLQTADETIINSLKGDNNADIQALKSQLQDKDDQIAQLNEKLVQVIASYETQLSAARTSLGSTANPPGNGKKIYPADDGFEQQNLGNSTFTFFNLVPRDAIHFNPPPPMPNQTGWKWGGDAGITTNGAFNMSGARNANHDGTTSTSGQVAFLQAQGGWFSQTIKLPPGTYSVSFDYEARPAYGDANGIVVSLDGTDLFLGAPADPSNFVHVTTQTITLPAGKECELKFRGIGALNDPTGDHTTLIDNVNINIIAPHAPSLDNHGVKSTAYQSDLLDGVKSNR